MGSDHIAFLTHIFDVAENVRFWPKPDTILSNQDARLTSTHFRISEII